MEFFSGTTTAIVFVESTVSGLEKTFFSISLIVATMLGVYIALRVADILIDWFKALSEWLIKQDGTTSGFSNFAREAGAERFASWFDRMTYRPFRGAPRGWQIRLSQRYPQVFPWWKL